MNMHWVQQVKYNCQLQVKGKKQENSPTEQKMKTTGRTDDQKNLKNLIREALFIAFAMRDGIGCFI